MLKDWDAFERLPEVDQVLLLEGLMSAAMMMTHLGECVDRRASRRGSSLPEMGAWPGNKSPNE